MGMLMGKLISLFAVPFWYHKLVKQRKKLQTQMLSKLTAIHITAGDRDRTGTGITTHGILSPGRLPVPPRQHLTYYVKK